MRRWLKRSAWVAVACLLLLVVATTLSLRKPVFPSATYNAEARTNVLDRNGLPLGISYQTRLNPSPLPLHRMPSLLRQAVVLSEDRRFFRHHGVDWPARLAALWQNIRAGRAVRGASTISEQVVRILHPRPRNIWSRWLEGFEANWLEQTSSKGEILEFYLNQVPYAANRRGVAQAARYYFNRDLDTLSPKELLTLAVLPRAPSALDPWRKYDAAQPALDRLASELAARGMITEQTQSRIQQEPLALEASPPLADAGHFIAYARTQAATTTIRNGSLRTTLDAGLQQRVQSLLDERLQALRNKHAHNAAALVVDHRSGEILAWAVSGGDDPTRPSTRSIDAALSPRQPGSALKPFLYAAALDRGWSAATILDDAPMSEAIGSGLHHFRNYSRTHYGKLPVREALGNSLNIPALLTIQFVGVKPYLQLLHRLGFTSLTQPADTYREGLALGNGEVSLFEMVQAYSALAQRGRFRLLTFLSDDARPRPLQPIFTPESASLIADILSDAEARRREFGTSGVLNLPVQTAVKTGTSTDYRDAWTLGFDARYTVGVWIGNLDGQAMDGVTGSTGSALVLRSIFARLNANQPPQRLWLSPKLVQRAICTDPAKQLADKDCYPRSEYFLAGSATSQPASAQVQSLRITRPTPGLNLAYDPRVPAEEQAFAFTVSGHNGAPVRWQLDGEWIGESGNSTLLWPLARGKHRLVAETMLLDGTVQQTPPVNFTVK